MYVCVPGSLGSVAGPEGLPLSQFLEEASAEAEASTLISTSIGHYAHHSGTLEYPVGFIKPF